MPHALAVLGENDNTNNCEVENGIPKNSNANDDRHVLDNSRIRRTMLEMCQFGRILTAVPMMLLAIMGQMTS